MSDNNNNTQELSFEQRISANFGGENTTASATKERLKDVNKKLPSWNLEPPLDFIK